MNKIALHGPTKQLFESIATFRRPGPNQVKVRWVDAAELDSGTANSIIIR